MEWRPRVRVVALVAVVAGLGIAATGFLYGVPLADAGLDSAQAMYEDQALTLSYDGAGRLTDRGSPEQAQEILALLRDDWAYPVDASKFDPSDPLVNTREELMYQYAVIVYHVKHGEVTVTLTEAHLADGPIEFRGVTYSAPGDYRIAPEAYYAELDRTHPIEGQLRAAWSPLALSLTSYLAAGHANQAAGELARMTSLGIGTVGLLIAALGGGTIWAVAEPRRKTS